MMVTVPMLGKRGDGWLASKRPAFGWRKSWALFGGAGIAIGALAWGNSESIANLLWLLLLPLAWGRAGSRLAASALMAGYFLAGTRALPGGAVVFFGDEAPQWFGAAMWAVASLLLTLPFAAAWRQDKSHGVRFCIAVCFVAVPPLGLIGWINPLSFAGVVLPGSGWPGLVYGVIIVATIVECRASNLVLVASGLLAMSLISVESAKAPTGWAGVDTSFAKLSSDGSDDARQILASMSRLEWIDGLARRIPRESVVILPETVLGSINPVTEYHLYDIEKVLRAKNAKIIVGAEIPVKGDRYTNSMIVLGSDKTDTRSANQSIPVPVSMWKPFTSSGAVANIAKPRNIMTVGARAVGVAICYEQLLPYSLIATLSGKPDILLGISNVWWARSTNIPLIQFQTMYSFARLFGVPLVTAKNI